MDRQTILWIVIPSTALLLLVPALRVFCREARLAWEAGFSAPHPRSWSTGQKCSAVGVIGAIGSILFGGYTGLDIWGGGVGIVCSTIVGLDKKKRDAEKKPPDELANNPWVSKGDGGGNPP